MYRYSPFLLLSSLTPLHALNTAPIPNAKRFVENVQPTSPSSSLYANSTTAKILENLVFETECLPCRVEVVDFSFRYPTGQRRIRQGAVGGHSYGVLSALNHLFSADIPRRAWALEDIHLTLEPCSVSMFTGISGSGKSTLIQRIAKSNDHDNNQQQQSLQDDSSIISSRNHQQHQENGSICISCTTPSTVKNLSGAGGFHRVSSRAEFAATANVAAVIAAQPIYLQGRPDFWNSRQNLQTILEQRVLLQPHCMANANNKSQSGGSSCCGESTIGSSTNRLSLHGVMHALIERYARALDLPLHLHEVRAAATTTTGADGGCGWLQKFPSDLRRSEYYRWELLCASLQSSLNPSVAENILNTLYSSPSSVAADKARSISLSDSTGRSSECDCNDHDVANVSFAPIQKKGKNVTTVPVMIPAPVLLLDEWMEGEPSSIIQKVQRGLWELAKHDGAVIAVVTHEPQRWNPSYLTTNYRLSAGRVVDETSYSTTNVKN